MFFFFVLKKVILSTYSIATPGIGYINEMFQFGQSTLISRYENYSEVKLAKDFGDVKDGLRKER